MSLAQRITALHEAGADEVLVQQFTAEFASQSPQSFITTVLLPLHPDVVVVGENFTFGANASGNPATLLNDGRFEVVVVPLVAIGVLASSSTLVRQALAVGDVAMAASHLGRPFAITGEVVVGDQRGHSLGYPTANLALSADADLLVPADGVYAGWLRIAATPDPHRMPAAISVGSNPTFQHVERRVEAHAIGRADLELYGQEVTVEFVTRLRDMVRFNSRDELVSQLAQDVLAVRAALT
jgi:riboflavin kinase/FMN adenylyltransferase